MISVLLGTLVLFALVISIGKYDIDKKIRLISSVALMAMIR